MDRYDAFLFDWDGTIAKSLEVWLEVVRECYGRHGFAHLTDSEIVKVLGGLRVGSLAYGMPEDVYRVFSEEVKTNAKARMPGVPLYGGVETVLEQLHNHSKKVCLITTNWRQVIDSVLEAHGIADDFDVIVSGDDTKAHKPDPEGILIALEKLEVPKDKAIMLGDTAHDMGAANNAGIDSVLYYPASHELFYDFAKLQKLKPTYIISDWSGLFDALEK